ncbi:hypothetical protein KDL29_14210 [bacterium]|nr:hypothetical protein [bacterium]
MGLGRTVKLACLAMAVLMLASCFDPEPATITVSCTLQGLQRKCDILLQTEDGNVTRRTTTNIRGIGEFKYILPGDYVLKFVDTKDKAWPAVREVSVRSGEVLPIRVELTEAEAQREKAASDEA